MSDAEQDTEWTTNDQWPGSSWDDEKEPDAFSLPRGDAHRLYSESLCTAALRGRSLPAGDVDAWAYTLQVCVLRGIRFRDGFATELLQIKEGDSIGAFHRALHARAIMSNRIPDITEDADIPYCIWYPDTASEDTYREIACRYPQMRYHVGRACAVAGYNNLYRELDLLPDISIAEEARDSVIRNASSSSSSQLILDHILSQPVRYNIMNDYTRHVKLDSPSVARFGLNGDTAVVSALSHRRHFTELRLISRVNTNGNEVTLQPPLSHEEEPAPSYFDITEDWSLDGVTTPSSQNQSEDKAMLELLWSPLPHDLPAGNKDLLILMAAYNGDVDRYARLHRPHPVSLSEDHCIHRGIYHSTAFAKWWSLQTEHPRYPRFVRSIHARFIMCNDLSRIDETTDDQDLPRQIWYPLLAQPATYLELARRKPSLLYVVARALVVADHHEAWDTLAAQSKIEPYLELMEEARVRSGRNTRYMQSLERICAERGLCMDRLESKYSPDDKPFLSEPTSMLLSTAPTLDSIHWEQPPPIYDGLGVDASEVELFIASSGQQGQQMLSGYMDLEQLYHEQQTFSTVPGEESSAYSIRGQMPARGGRGGRGGRDSGRGVPYGYSGR
ncbi:hypothetical protein SBRCBS47491_005199 [Sporothrix bragantina]|uniref:Uncharacterized protein n=1 Tax=Sporothrix bragantina TaxID=671064 RepID=A0ABP0BVF9_9PEZI